MEKTNWAILQKGKVFKEGDDISCRVLFDNLTGKNEVSDRAKYMASMRTWDLDLDLPISLRTPEGTGEPVPLDMGDHPRCPSEPRWDGDIVGCGSYHVEIAEEEPDLLDCGRCGIWFNLKALDPCPSDAEYNARHYKRGC